MSESREQPSSWPQPTEPSAVQEISPQQLHRPEQHDRAAWQAYWHAQGQPWRTEPEISAERQQWLAEQRALPSDWKQGRYPFGGVELDRADVEWLLATHQGGLGPVEWRDARQRDREGLDLRGALLRGVDLSHVPLAGVIGGLNRYERAVATHEQRHLAALQLQEANLYRAHLEGSVLARVRLERANLESAGLDQADLSGAHLEGAYLRQTRLQGAHLYAAQLSEARFIQADLRGADLRYAWLDGKTELSKVEVDPALMLGDIAWNGVPLQQVNWTRLPSLGDEQHARRSSHQAGEQKTRAEVVEGYQAAVRAYRQLALVLRSQGLNEEADRFTYRAQLLQRVVFRLQRQGLKYAFSWMLALLTGYGFRMGRIIIAYALAVCGFASLYYSLGFSHPPRITWEEAFILSITAFHGRVFSTPFTPDSPQVIVTAVEAVTGLLIEAIFIAMLTQRFFSR